MQAVEIFKADQLRPNPWLPQHRQWPIKALVDENAYAALKNRRLAMYGVQVTLASLKAGRATIAVDPGFALTTIMVKTTAASPADGLGSAQVIMYDPARRIAFSRIPVVLPIFGGSGGTGGAPLMLRSPYEWRGGVKAPVQMQIQNRASAANVITILLIGRDKQ